jgi:hypothetical protein
MSIPRLVTWRLADNRVQYTHSAKGVTYAAH